MIKTNNQQRDLLYLEDFTEKEQQVIRSEYDWMEPDIECNFGFFKYRGNIYHLQDFLRAPDSFKKDWDGYISETYFSGVVIKLADDNDHVVVGRWFS